MPEGCFAGGAYNTLRRTLGAKEDDRQGAEETFLATCVPGCEVVLSGMPRMSANSWVEIYTKCEVG